MDRGRRGAASSCRRGAPPAGGRAQARPMYADADVLRAARRRERPSVSPVEHDGGLQQVGQPLPEGARQPSQLRFDTTGGSRGRAARTARPAAAGRSLITGSSRTAATVVGPRVLGHASVLVLDDREGSGAVVPTRALPGPRGTASSACGTTVRLGLGAVRASWDDRSCRRSDRPTTPTGDPQVSGVVALTLRTACLLDRRHTALGRRPPSWRAGRPGQPTLGTGW